MTRGLPKISIYSTCKNNARYLRDTLDSILSQSYDDYEVVLADGASTDETLEILRHYSRDHRVRWISEPDGSAVHGFYKALSLTRGDYIMCLPVSDCYLSKTWLARCVAALDSDIEVSMVHGHVMRMHEDGSLLNPLHPGWCESPPPDKLDYFAYWLATFMHASEITYCVRSEIYRRCYPPYEATGANYAGVSDPLTDSEFDHCGPHLRFIYNFHTNGYLGAFLPVMASGARENADNLTTAQKRYIRLEAKKYTSDIIAYREAVLGAAATHTFQNGRGEAIRSIKRDELDEFAGKIRHYRENERLMFDYIDEANLYHKRRTELFRAKWDKWRKSFGKGCRVAIYGGGMHTEQLLDIVGREVDKLNVVAIVDRRPMSGERIGGIPVVEKSAFDFSKVEHVIISSKCHEDEIYRELMQILPISKVERIYAE